MKPTILVVEDEPSLRKLLLDDLSLEGYNVVGAEDGERGLQLSLEVKPSLIILDVMLPKLSGIDVARQLKAKKIAAPIIMLSARSQESDKILGFDLGIDDYVTKPFSMLELLARIKAVLNRTHPLISSQEPIQKVLAVMITDMKDSTRKSTSLTRQEMLELMDKYHKLIELVINKYHGELINTVSDSTLAVFESPTNAVLAGIDIQCELQTYNNKEQLPDKKIELYIGIHVGEITIAPKEREVYGESANIASRIAKIGESGKVYITEAVVLSMNRQEVKLEPLGDHTIKGIPHTVKLYNVLPRGK